MQTSLARRQRHRRGVPRGRPRRSSAVRRVLIAIPILLEVRPKPGDSKTKQEPTQVNEASALWTRPKAQITDEQYRDLNQYDPHAYDEPFARLHLTAEGALS